MYDKNNDSDKERWFLVRISGMGGARRVFTKEGFVEGDWWVRLSARFHEYDPPYNSDVTELTEKEKDALKAIMSIKDD